MKTYKYNYKVYKLIKLCKLIILVLFLLNHKYIISKDIISIIIPTYNREKYILNSIKSVLNQTYNNIEIIVIDDCSTDNTKSEISKIKDRRIRYIKLNNNNGAAYARNFGIKLAKGKYISFQDSDDIYHYDKLKEQLSNLNRYKSDLDFCKISVTINNNTTYYVPDNITENKILNGDIYDELLCNGNFISTQSILVKKSFVEKYLFDIRFPRLQDFDLILRIIPNIKVSFTNKVLVSLYRQNDSISSSPIKLKESISLLLNKNYNLNFTQKKKFFNYLNCLKKTLRKEYKLVIK